MKLEVQQDETGELFIEFPNDLLLQLGWKPGDMLNWAQQDSGNWIITKKEKLTLEDNDNEY